ncbi:MAG: YidC/Oxa1 family insertase periplasmic-domain containing protein, partial [Planctomycetia bacterium]
MERRYALFIAFSLAIVLGGQLLQSYLFPKPPAVVTPAEDAVATLQPDAEISGEPAAADPGRPSDAESLVDEQPVATPREYCTLGSLDPDGPVRMLVTLTSRGAAVERIELAGKRFHDQDDRSGYLGHLALTATPDGCRAGVVGPGTPAAVAGIRTGDVITTIDGVGVPDVRGMNGLLAKMKPGQQVVIDLRRDGQPLSVRATLARRPLEVVRPELQTQPAADPEGLPCDPLSFRFSLESRDGRKRPEPLREIAGQELQETDWEIDPAVDGSRVRFTRRLPGGLSVTKEYAVVPEDSDGRRQGYRLAMTVELSTTGKPTSVVYALDGPTGLPTEGWWYAARVARDWGSLAVRDVAMRFIGERTTLVSGLKMAEGSLAHPSTAVLDSKPLSFAGVDALYFASALIPAATGPQAPALEEVRPLVVGDVPAAARRKLVDVTCRLVSRPLELSPGAVVSHRYDIFAGPKQPDLLADFGAAGASMDDLVYYGWFG